MVHLDRRPGGPDHTGRRATGLVARFGSLPFRQLAGPAALFFLWPPKSGGRTGTSPRGQR